MRASRACDSAWGALLDVGFACWRQYHEVILKQSVRRKFFIHPIYPPIKFTTVSMICEVVSQGFCLRDRLLAADPNGRRNRKHEMNVALGITRWPFQVTHFSQHTLRQ
jgi:hypothetical protein